MIDAGQAAAWGRRGVLLDARAGERYRGEIEPVDPRAGHIPGARQRPDHGEPGAPGASCRRRSCGSVRGLGVDGATSRLAVYCGSGVTAAHEVAALEIAGFPRRALSRSFSEWSNDAPTCPWQPVKPGDAGRLRSCVPGLLPAPTWRVRQVAMSGRGGSVAAMTPGRPVPPPLALPDPARRDDCSRIPAPRGAYAAACGAVSATADWLPLTLARRAPKADDVEIAIEFCGLCHSDVHATRGEWGAQNYPLVPGPRNRGHGSAAWAQPWRISPRATAWAWAALVDSCRECDSCLEGLEQYCERGMTGTYGAKDSRNGGSRSPRAATRPSVVVDRRYVLRVPANLDPAAVAPLLCAGITTFSPLRHFDVEEGDAVGVVGLGGLWATWP